VRERDEDFAHRDRVDDRYEILDEPERVRHEVDPEGGLARLESRDVELRTLQERRRARHGDYAS
jgi:hypothetical protein